MGRNEREGDEAGREQEETMDGRTRGCTFLRSPYAWCDQLVFCVCLDRTESIDEFLHNITVTYL